MLTRIRGITDRRNKVSERGGVWTSEEVAKETTREIKKYPLLPRARTCSVNGRKRRVCITRTRVNVSERTSAARDRVKIGRKLSDFAR